MVSLPSHLGARRDRRPYRTLSIVAWFALALAVAHGQGAAMVDPASQVHVAAPGEAVAGSVVRVTNPTESMLRLRVYLSDWTLDMAGQFTFADVGTLEAGASNWITFQPSVLEIAPRTTVEVRYDIQVPADAAPGTHQSVLFVETEPARAEPGMIATTFSVRVGHVIYVNVPPLVKEGAISAIFGEPPVTAGEPYRMTVLYVNSGNSAQGVEGRLVVTDASGIAVIETDIERTIVLPASERAFSINLIGPLPAGDYTALVVLDYGDAEREVAGTLDFRLPEGLAASPDGAL